MSGKLSGDFAELTRAEAVARELLERGVPPTALEVIWLDECAACAQEASPDLDPMAVRALGLGQLLGALAGLAFGAAGGAGGGALLVTVVSLGCWAAGGAILGAMIGALLLEARPRAGPRHRHLRLSVEQEALPPGASALLQPQSPK